MADAPLRGFGIGVREIVPLAVGVAIYGMAFGLLAAQARFDAGQIGVMGVVVFAGSSQIVAAQQLVAGAGAGAAVVAGLALNLPVTMASGILAIWVLRNFV